MAKMADIWADLLAVESVQPTDNFFKLGGDSLMATNLVVMVEQRFGLRMDPIEVFNTPILADFAQVVAANAPLQSAGDGEYEEGVL